MSAAPLPVQLDALRAGGVVAFWVLADSTLAEELWRRALPIAEGLREPDVTDWIERMLAGVVWERGDLEAALPLREQGLATARASGDRLREADALHCLAR